MNNDFNPGFDREKAAFIELANRGEGLTPINYLYAKEANFESMLSAYITGGTADVFTLYSSGILSFIDNGEGKAPYDATYILQRPDSELPNAQGLSDLAPGGILKSSPLGVVSIASGGKTPVLDDYVDPLSLQEEIEATIAECNAFATAEAAAAEAAAIAAGIAYFTEQMLPFSLIPLVPAGASITAAIAAAVLPKENITDHNADINAVNERIDNLNVNLVGDVLGVGLLSSPVITLFKPNPVFTGKESMTIPVGNNLERPSILTPGMMRFNTSL
jgi:hypothetical protein